MKKIILTVLSTLVVMVLILVAYVKSGNYDISQASKHNSLTKWLIHETTENSIESRMGENLVPPNFSDTALLKKGFSEYNEMCVQCHGAPGADVAHLAKGLYPEPPKMYKRQEKGDPQEFFWIIKNGIKMTSMPAYGPSHNDQTLWAITAFVTEKLNKMSPEEYKDWSNKYAEEEEMEKHEEEDKD